MSLVKYTKKEFHELIMLHLMDEIGIAESISEEEENWKKFVLFLKSRNADSKLKMAIPKLSPRVKTLGRLTAAQLAEGLGIDDPVVVIT
jgi:hypothetical protein